MAILKNGNYKYLVIVVLSACSMLWATQDPAQVLIKSYGLGERLTSADALQSIEDLGSALELCQNKELACRIKYRIGILHFKNGEMKKSCGYFVDLAQEPQCHELLKLCSLNMLGQIYRMEASDDNAINTFEELISLSTKYTTKDPNTKGSMPQLLRQSAFFAKAEIYQYQGKYQQAIDEYKKVAEDMEKNGYPAGEWGTVGLDRLSQLYIMQGDVDNYVNTSQSLLRKYPAYYRAAIIQFEIEAVKFLDKAKPKTELSRGSIDAPVKMILFLKDNNKKDQTEKTIALLQELRKQYHDTYGGLLVSYHCAWLMDAIGQKEEAAAMFESISKAWQKIVSQQPRTAFVLATIADYAKLEQSILLGETGKFRNALETIDSVKRDPNDVHVTELTESIKKSLETLKREVPKDANNK